MQRRRKRAVIRWIIIIAAIAVWLVINPPLKFGLHCFWLTVYSGIPIPVADVRIRSNGIPTIRGSKSHDITNTELKGLIGTNENRWPEIIVIGTGYENKVNVEGDAVVEFKIPIEAYPTPQAIDRFNKLRSQGRRVAAIIHSGC